MSSIEFYRGDLCHFHLLSIENIADFVTCSSIRAVCARVHACVCVVDKFIQNQADGGAVGGRGGVGERSPHCGQII